jgi:ribokinase
MCSAAGQARLGAASGNRGGFAAALAEGQSLAAAARFGCAAAGLSVTRNGAAPSMPSRTEVQALLEKQG